MRVCLFIAGCTAHALIEGMIYAAKTANVDVINMSIGGLPSLNDGNNARAVLYDRLIDKYDVQMFISAGNSGPGENTVGDPSVATDGDERRHVHLATRPGRRTTARHGSRRAPTTSTRSARAARARTAASSRRSSRPGAAISTTPLWQPGGPVAGVHALPPGYSMLNGTSMASPQAAGAAALLVSAAKQAGVAARPRPAPPGAELVGAASSRRATGATSRATG